MKGVAVALLVAAAAFAPTSARAETPFSAATIDRAADTTADPVPPDAAIDLYTNEPAPKDASGVTVRSDDPSRTLPPTDTDLPAVDGRH